MQFKYNTKFFKGSAVLIITTGLSYVLGLIRDRQFAHVFGASHALDAYNAAFLIPDLILNVFVAGALTAAFIPLFTELTTTNAPEEERMSFVNSVLNSSLLVVVLVGILVLIFARPLSYLVVRGFDPASRDVYVNLLRILLLSPIIFAVSNTLGSILASRERFFWYGMSTVFYNLGTILGILLLAPRFGIYGAAIGTLFGALLHLLPRFLHTRSDVQYRPHISITARMRQFARMMLPKMVGQPIEQFTFLGFTVLASSLGTGSIAIMNFAHNFQAMPINVIGVTFALTIFPALSRAAAQKDKKLFQRDLVLAGLVILGISTIAAIILYVIRHPLISILIGGGAFDTTAINATAAALAVFTLSIPSESLSHLLARGFYSLKDSLTPTIINLFGLGAALLGAWHWSHNMGVTGIAFGFLAGSLVKLLLYLPLLTMRTKKLLNPEVGRS